MVGAVVPVVSGAKEGGIVTSVTGGVLFGVLEL